MVLGDALIEAGEPIKCGCIDSAALLFLSFLQSSSACAIKFLFILLLLMKFASSFLLPKYFVPFLPLVKLVAMFHSYLQLWQYWQRRTALGLNVGVLLIPFHMKP